MKRAFGLALALAIGLLAVQSPSAATGPWVSAFYAGYAADAYPPSAIDFSALTHVIVFAAVPQSDGTLDTSLFINAIDGPLVAQEIAQRAHAAGKKAILSVGGADSEVAFASAMDNANRAAFIQNIVQTVNAWGYDGVDIDWEPLPSSDYPAVLALLNGLRAAKPTMTMTVDVGWLNANFPLAGADATFYAQLAAAVDQMNMMTYGMADNWGGWKSWHSSAVRGQGGDHPSSIDGSVNGYLAAGVPAAKLGIGIGAYGSCWNPPVTAPLQDPGASNVIAEDNDMSFANIMTLYYSASAYRYDTSADAPYLTFASAHAPNGCTFVSYEDESSIAAKGNYLRQKGLGGLMVWQLNEAYNPAAPDPSSFLHALGHAAFLTVPPHAAGDYDGDGRSDATLFKANGDWASMKSSGAFASSSSVNWTSPGYVPVRGDFDGDGRHDPALYNPTTGAWRILRSTTNFTSSIVLNWGGPGYSAVPGDYDGDGKTDPAVYNITSGAWSILKSSSAYTATLTINWGGTGYTPIPGQDFDGDLITDVAVYRPATGVWSVRNSSAGFATAFNIAWGGPGYTLVPGDYDGDRKADLGLYQVATGAWFILKSSAGYSTSINASLGGVGFLPVPADYDGDGKFDPAVYQQSTGNWSALKSTTSYATTLTIAGWGSAGDVVISSAIAVGVSDLARAGDFDGDVRSEITIYNSTSGLWSSLTSISGYASSTSRAWGGAGYTPVPGDFDGDGRADLGVYQPSTGNWYVLLSGANFTTALSKSVGGSGWIPASGDYDGDGKTDLMVYNTATGQWYGLKSSSNYTTTLSINYGGTGYTAVPADFDGDGRTDIAVYQATSGNWSVLLSASNYTSGISRNVGGPGYAPVQADYDGDGKADLVVYNGSTGLWYGLKSSSNYATTVNVTSGGTGYLPVKGDYDGDGKADIATYRASTGAWSIVLSGSNYASSLSRTLGGASTVPVPQYP